MIVLKYGLRLEPLRVHHRGNVHRNVETTHDDKVTGRTKMPLTLSSLAAVQWNQRRK